MAGDAEVRRRILKEAEGRFLRLGFTKVTMEEIAAGLGMSKKTLYQHFPGKDDLLREVVHGRMAEIEAGVRRITDDAGTGFVEKLKQLMAFMGMKMADIGQAFMEDLHRYAPEIWEEIDRFRREQILDHFRGLIDEGVQKGLCRADVDRQIAVLVYASAVQGIVNPGTLSQLPLSVSEAQQEILKVVFEGILTDGARGHKAAHLRR